MSWNNWDKTVDSKPLKIFYPKNKQELLDIINQLKKGSLSVHAYGSLHSWNDIVPSNYLINTNKLKKVLFVDKQKHQIKVECGITIDALNKVLTKEGLALPNMGETTAQTLAGLISTATHGTGHTGTTSSFVTSIELITSQGDIITFSNEQTPEEFPAVITSIGALGVIYSITLQCVPLFYLNHSRIQTTWDEIKNNYKDLYEKNDYFMFYVNPYNKKAINYIFNKTDKPQTNQRTLSFFRHKNNFSMGFATIRIWNAIFEAFPFLIPYCLNSYFKFTACSNIIDYGYKLLSQYKRPSQHMDYYESEIAVPFDNLLDAANDTFALIEKHKKLKFHAWVMLFRFVKADKTNYLSPAAQRDSVYISITSAKTKDNMDFYKEFQQAMLKYKGRPHWGKINFLTYDIVHQLYGENLDKFIAAKNKLDPKKMFANKFVNTVLTGQD